MLNKPIRTPCFLGRQTDGVEYTQSTALLTYAGKIGGLYPEDALAALKVNAYHVVWCYFTCFATAASAFPVQLRCCYRRVCSYLTF